MVAEETLWVLKNREVEQFGEYRISHRVLEAWGRLHSECLMPEPYDRREKEERRT